MRLAPLAALCLTSLALAACNSSEANIRMTPAPLPELEGKWLPVGLVGSCADGHIRFAPNAIYAFNGGEPRKMGDILRITVAGPKLDVLIANADRNGEHQIVALDSTGGKIAMTDLKTAQGESLKTLPAGVPTTFREQAAASVKSVAPLEKLERCGA